MRAVARRSALRREHCSKAGCAALPTAASELAGRGRGLRWATRYGPASLVSGHHRPHAGAPLVALLRSAWYSMMRGSSTLTCTVAAPNVGVQRDGDILAATVAGVGEIEYALDLHSGRIEPLSWTCAPRPEEEEEEESPPSA